MMSGMAQELSTGGTTADGLGVTVLVRLVDAFIGPGLQGNPAGVVLLDHPAPTEWMQALAAEVGLSETAFLLPGPADESAGTKFVEFQLRWFSPTVEIPLCGHATLAAAHTLWTEGVVAPERTIVFHTLSGLLRVSQDHGPDGGPVHVTLDFPVAQFSGTDPSPEIRALVDGEVLGGVIVEDMAGVITWLLEVADEATLRAHRADDDAMAAAGIGGLIITTRVGWSSRADARAVTTRVGWSTRADGRAGTTRNNGPADVDYDIVSRCFFPGAGIPEDPVTGAAHCALVRYWAPRFGRTELVGVQASARGGLVHMRWEGERVYLGGQAVTSGQVHVPA